MKKWLIMVIGVCSLVGAAYGVRQSGIDLAALAGLQQLSSLQSTPQKEKAPQVAAPGARRGGDRPSPVETAKAATSQLSDDIAAIGTLLADKSVAIAPETAGRVAEIHFEDGAAVEEGTALFKLDTDLANAALAEARARLALAEATFARYQLLRKSGNVAESTYDAALTEREVAQAAVESAQVQLRKLTITAPFSGILGFSAVSEGAYVTPGTALVQLDKIDRLRVSFSVPELVQSRISVGQEIDVAADALPGERFVAVVSAISPSIDVNGRALQVRADLDNSALRLRPGLLVRVTVKGQTRQAVLVPESAIVQRGDTAFVFTVADNKATESKVQLGKRIPGQIEIVEGIAPGTEVVVAGNTRLINGASVEIVQSPPSVE
jgi:membrane fusion protein (multidrug efflux system)